MHVAPRWVAVALILAVASPPPAFALREKATVEKDRATLAGLEDALRDPHAALARLAQLAASPIARPVGSDPRGGQTPSAVVPAPSTPFVLSHVEGSPVEGRPPLTTGLEERPARLGVGAEGSPIEKALQRFDEPARAELRRQISRLITQLVKRKLDPAPILQYILPAVAKALTPEQFTAGLALATRLTERGLAPTTTLFALPVVANALTPEQFTEALALATRLVEQEINPDTLLRYALPAAAKALTLEQFTEALALATRLVEQEINPDTLLRYALPAAAKALTPAQFTAALALATRLAEQKIDPQATLRALPAAAEALTPEQFAAALALATRLAERGIDSSFILKPYGAPADVIRASPTPEILQANLTALETFFTHLVVEHQMDPETIIKQVLPAAVFASHTPTAFRASLMALEGYITRLHPPRHPTSSHAGLEERPERLGVKAWWATRGMWKSFNAAFKEMATRYKLSNDDQARLRGHVNHFVKQLVVMWPSHVRTTLEKTLPAVAEASPTLEAFQTNLTALEQLVVRLAERGIHPVRTLEYRLPVAAGNGTPDQFTTDLAFATRLAAHGIDPADTLQYGLPAVVPAGWTPADFQATLTARESLVVRLAERGIDPNDILRYALPAVARASRTPADFQTNLTVLEQLTVYLAARRIDPSSTLHYALPAVARASRTPADFQANLAALEQLMIRIAERGINPQRDLPHALSALAEALTPEQFTEALALATRLAERRIDPSSTLHYALPAVAQASRTPADFQANLTELERFIVRLVQLRLEVSPTFTLLWKVLPAIASPTPADFQANLAALEVLLTRLAAHGIDPADTLWYLWYALPAVARASPTPADFQANLRVLEELCTRLGTTPGFAWSWAASGETAALSVEAIRLHRDGVDYRIEAAPEGIRLVPLTPPSSQTGLEERRVAEMRDVAVAAWGMARPAITGLPTLVTGSPVVIESPDVFNRVADLVPLLVMREIPVAVRVDGPAAGGLEELLARLSMPKGPYAIGPRTEAFLAEYEPPVVITSRTQLLALVGLEEDTLPPAVTRTVTMTKTFLDLSV